MEPYDTILNAIRPKVSFGCATIHVYRPSELKVGQVGYSISPTGESLVGDKDGDWRSTWLVIGYDETCGDPIFIDRSKEEYPVYTAMIGKGRWDAVPIAVSLQAFGRALSAIAAVAEGRENPVALEQTPLPESEKDRVLAAIRQHNPQIGLDFWQILLTES
jgi:hypothetical protein